MVHNEAEPATEEEKDVGQNTNERHYCSELPLENEAQRRSSVASQTNLMRSLFEQTSVEGQQWDSLSKYNFAQEAPYEGNS